MKTRVLHIFQENLAEIVVRGEVNNDKAGDVMQIALSTLGNPLVHRLLVDLRATRLPHDFSLFHLFQLAQTFSTELQNRNIEVFILHRGEESKCRYMEKTAKDVGLRIFFFSNRVAVRKWLARHMVPWAPPLGLTVADRLSL